MRKLLLMTAAIMLALPAAAKEAPGPDQKRPLGAKGQWQRIFSEEFDGKVLDLEKWTTCYWWNDNGCTNLSSGELQWFLPGNVTVSDGILRLTARRQWAVGWKNRNFPFTSGMVTTGFYYDEQPRPPRAGFHFGHFEIRAKVPPGRGLWSAIWLLPATRQSRPEIDVMEVLGHAPRRLHMNIHYLNAEGEKRKSNSKVKVVDLSRDWHIYGLRWEKDAVIYYLDGVEQWRYTDAAHIPNESMYLLMTLSVGGFWPGPPDATTEFPAEFQIDYVRVWRRAEQ